MGRYRAFVQSLSKAERRRLRAWAVDFLQRRGIRANSTKRSIVLDDRLRVPKGMMKRVPYPKSEVLKAFQYEIERQAEPELVRQPDGKWKQVEVVETVTVSTYLETRTHYLFSRGDLLKLEHYFGDIPWIDRRCDVDVSHIGVEFTSTLRPDQERVLEKWLEHMGGIFRADTGWGKTVATIALLCTLGQRVLILVEEKSCGQNWIDEFRAHTNITQLEDLGELHTGGRRAAELIGFYGKTGPKGHFWPFVTVATYQSFLQNDVLRKARHLFGAVWVDEVDRVGAEGYSRVMNVTNPIVRGGCTATIRRNDGLEELVFDIVGPVVSHGREKMMNAQIHQVFTGVKVPDYKTNYWWTQAMSFVVGKKGTKKDPGYGSERYFRVVLNNIIKTVEDGRWVVVVSERNGFLQRLLIALVESDCEYFSKRDSAMLLIGESQRDKVIHAARNGKCRVTLAQAKLIRRAINVKPWDCLHLVTPMSGWTKNTRKAPAHLREPNAELTQVVGRVRRRMKDEEWLEFARKAGLEGTGKPTPIVYDYVAASDPDLSGFGDKSVKHTGRFFASTYMSRQGAYQKLGFDVLGAIIATDKVSDLQEELEVRRKGGWRRRRI